MNSDNNKIIKFIVLILVIIIVVIGTIFLLSPKKTIISNTKINYDYFALYLLDNTVGVVDKNGNILIDSEYTNVYIPNQSKDVFFCYKDDTYVILNSKGQELFKEYENVFPLVISELTSEMEKEVLRYEKNGKYGLIDYSGKKITEAIYDDISSLKNKPGFISVKKDGAYGVLDSNGTTIIPIKYYSIKGDEYCSEKTGYLNTGYIVSEKTKNGIIYGYIDYNGKVLVSPKYESMSRALEYEDDDIYLIVMQNGKKGIIKNKKVIVKPKYQEISYYNTSNVFAVAKNKKYGVLDNDGNEILKVQFTSYSITGNYISVKDDKGMYLYDLHGNLVNNNTYKSITETGNPSYFIAQYDNGYYSIISKDVSIENKYTNIEYAFDNFYIFTNEQGKSGVLNVYTGVEIEPEYDYILVLENARALEARKGQDVDIYSEKLENVLSTKNTVVEKVSDEYISIYSDTELYYINKKGNIVPNTEVYKDLELYSYKAEDGKWGFADKIGNIIVSCKYDIVTELNEYGFAGVCQDGKWGVIDKKGNVIVVPTYEIETYYFPKFIGKYLLEELEDTHCKELEK